MEEKKPDVIQVEYNDKKKVIYVNKDNSELEARVRNIEKWAESGNVTDKRDNKLWLAKQFNYGDKK